MAERQLVLIRAPAEQAARWLAACNGSRHWIERSDNERSERAEVTERLAQIIRLGLEKLLAR